MSKRSVRLVSPQLAEVARRFERWRRSREKQSRVPEELWAAAAALSTQHSVNEIARTLHLNHTSLKARISSKEGEGRCDSRTSRFVEVELGESQVGGGCVVEMQEGEGARMRIYLGAGRMDEVVRVAEAMWRQRR
jgi:hypothetical protein